MGNQQLNEAIIEMARSAAMIGPPVIRILKSELLRNEPNIR